MARKQESSDTGRNHGNRGGRPPGPGPSGPVRVLADLEKVLSKTVRHLSKGKNVDHKVLAEYVRGLMLYPPLHRLARGEASPDGDPEAIFRTGRPGAYEEILQETPVKIDPDEKKHCQGEQI